jgi:hypothetical protein
MKLTNFIVDIGRPVAYYPSLKKITLSTTASILLCQFLYWSDKTEDGWFWKTAEQLMDETGLTYSEQKTARERLIETGLVEEQYHRLDHEMWFRVNQEELNKRWEETGGQTTKPITKTEKPKVEVKPKPQQPAVQKKEEPKVTKVEKKGDLVDLMIDQKNWVGFKNTKLKEEIKDKIRMRLRINPDGRRWDEFIEHALNRQKNHNEPVDKFIDWLIVSENFKPQYWTPERMITFYPQAFNEIEKPLDKKPDFVVKLPEIKEEEYVPMPTGLGKKNNT